MFEGERIDCVEISTHRTRTKSSDTMQGTAHLHTKGAAFWADKEKMDGVSVVFNGVEQMTADITNIKIKWHANTVSFSGQDKSAKLARKGTTEQIKDKTVKEAIQKFCDDNGLKLEMSDSAIKAGREFKDSFNDLTHAETQYDATQRYMHSVGNICYVKGDTLYVKRADETDATIDITYVPPTPESYARGNFMELETGRNLVVAKGVKTTVKSWNSKKKKIIKSEKDSGGSDPVEYKYYHPDLTQEQADKLAESNHDKNTSHELTLSLSMYGDENLTPHHKINLKGTKSKFDQTYFIQSIDDRMSQSGYRATIEAKNKPDKK